MWFQYKNMKQGSTVTHITIEHEKGCDDILAIAVLLGAYNAHGRKMSVADYQNARDAFQSIIDDVKRQIK